MSSLYKKTELRTLSLEGGTLSDKAILAWNSMNHYERYEVMQKCYCFKCPKLRERACINYVADSIRESEAA